jgi:hypothetical protein
MTATRFFNNHPGANNVLTRRVLAWTSVIVLAGCGLLRAQEPLDSASTESSSISSDQNTSGQSATPANSPDSTPQRLTFRDRIKIYEVSFTNPESLIGPALGAGIGQMRNTPPEWGQGAAGFAPRLGSAYGRSIIARTIAFGVAAVDREDPRFEPSNDTGFLRRTRHAIVGVFVSRTESGGTMPAFSRFAGVYGAAFIANAWEPKSQDNVSHALERGTTALLSSVGWHILREFWPDIRNKFHRNRN